MLLFVAALKILHDEDSYVIGNYEVFGYYRVNYNYELWNLIIAELNADFGVSLIIATIYKFLISDSFLSYRGQVDVYVVSGVLIE